jgi:negative regulator of sigma E activity
LAWLQWIVPALVVLSARPLYLQKFMTRRGLYFAMVAGLGVAECVVALLFYFLVRPTLSF